MKVRSHRDQRVINLWISISAAPSCGINPLVHNEKMQKTLPYAEAMWLDLHDAVRAPHNSLDFSTFLSVHALLQLRLKDHILGMLEACGNAEICIPPSHVKVETDEVAGSAECALAKQQVAMTCSYRIVALYRHALRECRSSCSSNDQPCCGSGIHACYG